MAPPTERPQITVPPTSRGSRRKGKQNDDGSAAPSSPGRRDASPAQPDPDGSDKEFNDIFGDKKPTPKPQANPSKAKPYIPPPPGEGAVMESLGQSDIMQEVLSHKSAIRTCVDEQKKRDPGSSPGRLVVRWTVLPSGKTTGIAVQTDALKSSYLSGCITGLIKTWSFPKHRVQGDPIDFPFTF
jgi:hypothetical protein